ncbi:hypothetical protein C8J57DRAFT_1531262 [Mycena rebaudengoi]|nr:hypothetical protein C8J57DRAFT_1531262 [Mycena rebaudengoi]
MHSECANNHHNYTDPHRHNIFAHCADYVSLILYFSNNTRLALNPRSTFFPLQTWNSHPHAGFKPPLPGMPTSPIYADKNSRILSGDIVRLQDSPRRYASQVVLPSPEWDNSTLQCYGFLFGTYRTLRFSSVLRVYVFSPPFLIYSSRPIFGRIILEVTSLGLRVALQLQPCAAPTVTSAFQFDADQQTMRSNRHLNTNITTLLGNYFDAKRNV